MAKLLLAISGRVEEGEALSASVFNTATGTSALTGFTLQWQVFNGSTWTNVGAANSLTYTIPAGNSAIGKSYRLVSTPTGVNEASTSAATAPVVADTKSVHAPTLADVATSLSLAENATATVLDSAVTFSDADNGNFGGGSLTILNSNSLAAGGDGLDLLTVRNQSGGAGQITYNAATREVFHGAPSGNPVLIGVVSAALGGNGTDLKITFNTSATKAAVDRLIENIQFSNNDDSPTATRLLTIQVADATAGTVQRVMQVNIAPSADGPSFTGTAAFTVNENQTAAGVVAAVDPDREAGAAQGISYSLVEGAGSTDNALFTLDGATGQLSFASAPDFEGAHGAAYSVRVRASDSNGGVAERVVTVQVQGVNEGPVAQALLATVQEDAASATLAASFADPDAGDSHTITLDTTGTLGTVTREGSNFNYDAGGQFQSLAQGQTATDTFSYTVTDAGGLSSTHSATITIEGSNDAPTAGPAGTGEVREAGHFDDGSLDDGVATAQGSLSGNDVDNGNAISWSGSAGGTYGQFSIDNSGHWEFVLDNTSMATQVLAEGETVQDTFIATITDSHGAAAQQQVTITLQGSNDAPVIGTSSELTGLVQEPTVGSGMLVLDLAAAYGQDSTVVDGGGRIVVLGQAPGGGGSLTPAIMRLQADGTPDTTFGDGGTTSVTALFKPASIAVDPGGRYVSAGYTYANYGVSQLDWAIERRHPDGSLDTTFGNGGLVALDFGGYDQARSVDVTATGRILVSGYIPNPQSGLSELVVLALDPNGAPDLAFGDFGRLVVDGSSTNEVRDITVDAQGRIVAWGFTADPVTGATQLQVTRYLADGSPDNAFGSAGTVVVELPGTSPQTAQFALGSQGQMLVGWTEFSGDWDYRPLNLALLRPDGSMETGFGGAGWVQTGLNAETLELSFDAQGRPLAGFSGTVMADFHLARFNLDGTLDTSFRTGGTTSADLGGEETVEAIHFLQTGEVLVAGTSWQGSNLGTAFASFDEEGNLNTSFGDAPSTALTTGGALFVVGNGWDNGDIAQWTGSTTGQYGEFQLSSTGMWTYVLDVNNPATQALDEGTTGTEHFIATVTDSFGASASCEVVITVVGSYDPLAP